MSLVAYGARIMTSRGIVLLEHIHPGDMVLTSMSRFRPVASRVDREFSGEVVVIDRLVTVPHAQLYNAAKFRVMATAIRSYDILRGVDLAEWEDGLDRCMRGLQVHARGVVIEAAQGAIVLGISPEAFLGRALLTMRTDSHCTALVVEQRQRSGPVAEIVLGDRAIGEVPVYERFPVAGANAL